MADGSDRAGEMLVRSLTLRAPKEGDDSRVIECVASTEAEDTYGEVVEQVWNLDRYKANPVVLWAHNSREMPIGKASNVRVDGGELLATLELTTDDVNPKAGEVWRSYKAGLTRSVSVGFMPGSYRWEKRQGREVLVLSDNVLLEISVCSIGANPEALMKQFRARAIAERQGPTRGEEMTMKALLLALGLPETASETDALRAFAVRESERQELLGATGETTAAKGVGAIHALKVRAMKGDEAVAALAKIEAEREDDERTKCLAAIPPAERETYKALPLESLKIIAASDPWKVKRSPEARRAPTTAKGVAGLTDIELRTAKSIGVSPEDFAAENALRTAADDVAEKEV